MTINSECNLCGKPFTWFGYRCPNFNECESIHCSNECCLEHERECELNE